MDRTVEIQKSILQEFKIAHTLCFSALTMKTVESKNEYIRKAINRLADNIDMLEKDIKISE